MFGHLRPRFANWRLYRQAVTGLSGVDRRLLRDMGFAKGDLAEIKSCVHASMKEHAR